MEFAAPTEDVKTAGFAGGPLPVHADKGQDNVSDYPCR